MRVIHSSEINNVFGGLSEEAKQETKDWINSCSRAMGVLGFVSGASFFGSFSLVTTQSLMGVAFGAGVGAMTGYTFNYFTTNVAMSHVYGV